MERLLQRAREKYSQEMDVVRILRSLRLVHFLADSLLTAEKKRKYKQEVFKVTLDDSDESAKNRHEVGGGGSDRRFVLADLPDNQQRKNTSLHNINLTD